MTATEISGSEGSFPRWGAVVFLGLGIGCGLAAHLFVDRAESFAWQFGPPLAVLIGGLAFCLIADPRRWVVSAAGSVGLALLLGLLATTTILQFGASAARNWGFISIVPIAEALIIAQISVPFLQTWQEQGRPFFPYQRLFAHAWNNSLIVALSAAFTGFFWLILWLFSLLFGYVGFDQLESLIEQPAFAWSATAGVAALGVYAGRDYQRIVVAFRRIVFTLFSVLTPLYLVLALAFAIALAVGGFEKLSAVTSATATLIGLLIIGIVLFNAVLRDGTPETDASAMLRRCAALLAPALLALCAFAAYGIYLRIAQYGLTPERVWVTTAVAALALHCIAYTASLVARGGWMRVSRRANIGVAGVVALIAVLLQTPVADPYRLSANDQYRRLTEGTVPPQAFDFGHLRYELGAAGEEVLKRISSDSGKADPEVVKQRLALLDKTDHLWEWRRDTRVTQQSSVLAVISNPQRLLRVPSDLQVPDDFVPEKLHTLLSDCGPGRTRDCLITAIDLSSATGDELVLASRHASYGTIVHLFEKKPGGEGWLATVLSQDKVGPETWNSLFGGDFAAVPSNDNDLRIGGRTIRLRRPGFSAD